jgi:predicted DNA binding CopG/RHH family protein
VNYNFDQEELEILEAYEQGKVQSASDLEQKKREAQEVARNTLHKSKRVNLRLTERDFYLAHVRAQEEGLPYQTLLASIIHKYLTGRLVERT